MTRLGLPAQALRVLNGDRLALEKEQARRAQLEKEAEDQCRETEKKKPEINSFNPNRRVSKWIGCLPL